MSTLDLSPIVQPLLTLIGATITALLAVYVPKALDLFQARTGILQTDQMRATVMGAIQTAAGTLETSLDQGALRVAHINVSNSAVLAQAQAAVNAVPKAAAALGVTIDSAARMIVARVDTAAHGAVDAVAPVLVPVPAP